MGLSIAGLDVVTFMKVVGKGDRSTPSLTLAIAPPQPQSTKLEKGDRKSSHRYCRVNPLHPLIALGMNVRPGEFAQPLQGLGCQILSCTINKIR